MASRRHVDEPGRIAELIADEALAVDAHGTQARTTCLEDTARAHVSRIFERDFVAGLEQEAREEIQPLLGTADDDDFFR